MKFRHSSLLLRVKHEYFILTLRIVRPTQIKIPDPEVQRERERERERAFGWCSLRSCPNIRRGPIWWATIYSIEGQVLPKGNPR